MVLVTILVALKGPNCFHNWRGSGNVLTVHLAPRAFLLKGVV